MASVTKELYGTLFLILINFRFNLNGHMWLVVATLGSTCLEVLLCHHSLAGLVSMASLTTWLQLVFNIR